jgi:hypothetical protein
MRPVSVWLALVLFVTSTVVLPALIIDPRHFFFEMGGSSTELLGAMWVFLGLPLIAIALGMMNFLPDSGPALVQHGEVAHLLCLKREKAFPQRSVQRAAPPLKTRSRTASSLDTFLSTEGFLNRLVELKRSRTP